MGTVYRRAYFALVIVAAMTAHGLGTEEFGNAPLGEANYTDWPGIMPAINHPSRVYSSWVNGNEYFCYRGDTTQLNGMLLAFAESESPTREVFILPGPGTRSTFDQEALTYDWMLHILGGISRHVGSDLPAMDPFPTLTIYPQENIRLEDIEIPAGVSVLDIHDLRKRYLDALSGDDREVRGYVASLWAGADPYNPDAASAIAELLDDPNSWVQSMAAVSLGRMGRLAEPYLTSMRTVMAAQPDNRQIQEVCGKAIQSIEQSASPVAETVARFERQAHEIHEFVQQHRQDPPAATASDSPTLQ
jgi:hypothetical protein